MREEREAERASAAARHAGQPAQEAPRKRSAGRPVRRTRCARPAELEERIEQAEAELRELEDELADPGAWSTRAGPSGPTTRHDAAKRAVEELYEEWEAAATPAPRSGGGR